MLVYSTEVCINLRAKTAVDGNSSTAFASLRAWTMFCVVRLTGGIPATDARCLSIHRRWDEHSSGGRRLLLKFSLCGCDKKEWLAAELPGQDSVRIPDWQPGMQLYGVYRFEGLKMSKKHGCICYWTRYAFLLFWLSRLARLTSRRATGPCGGVDGFCCVGTWSSIDIRAQRRVWVCHTQTHTNQEKQNDLQAAWMAAKMYDPKNAARADSV